MKTPYHTYMEKVYDVAETYLDSDFTYTQVEIACREIAGEFKRPWESVLGDFEIACDEINEEDAR